MKIKRRIIFFSLIGIVGLVSGLLAMPVQADVNKIAAGDDVFLTAEKDFFGSAVQQVLQKTKAPLANYTETAGGKTVSAGELIWDASQTEEHGLNPKVLVATLSVQQGLQTFSPGQFSPFVNEMASKLWSYYSDYQAGNRQVTLKNGQAISFQSGANGATYALAKYFSPSSDKESALNATLEQWTNAYQGIFLQDPRAALPDTGEKTLGINQPPFLRLPFNQPVNNFYKINSFFDHSSPGVFDDYILRNDGKAYDGASFNSCILGISCYAGHNGLDYSTPNRTPIYAAAAGKVVYEYLNKDSSAGTVDSGLIIDHGNGYRTLYWHLDEHYVKLNDTVSMGQQLGLSGNIGRSSGAHLHFGLRKTVGSKNVDPFGWESKAGDPWGESFFAFQGGLVVDNRSPNAQLFYNKYWTQVTRGYNGEAWWSYTVSDFAKSTNWGLWSAYIEKAGDYNVYVYYPKDSSSTARAAYQVYYSGGIATVTVDQSSGGDQWLKLGTYALKQGNAAVILTDYTQELKKKIYYDAVKWELKSAATATELQTGTYDDTASAIKYSSKWALKKNLSGEYKNTYHLSTKTGDTVSFTFNGAKVSLLYTQGKSLGSVNVDIDNVYVDGINEKGSKTAHQVRWDSPLLAAGSHIVTIEHSGAGNVNIDAVIVAPAPPTATPTATRPPTSTPTAKPTTKPSPTVTRTPVPPTKTPLNGNPTAKATATRTLPVCTANP